MAIFKASYVHSQDFPLLSNDNHDLTSPRDTHYNCIAHAMGRDDVKYWPRQEPRGYTWPKGIPKAATLEAFKKLFESVGYSACGKNGTFEEGFEKVALYVGKDKVPTHAARQVGKDEWTSKLGNEEDISHYTVDAVAKGRYGDVAVYMKRKLPAKAGKRPPTRRNKGLNPKSFPLLICACTTGRQEQNRGRMAAGKSAWLITWDNMGCDLDVEHGKIVAALPARLSIDRVKDITLSFGTRSRALMRLTAYSTA